MTLFKCFLWFFWVILMLECSKRVTRFFILFWISPCVIHWQNKVTQVVTTWRRINVFIFWQTNPLKLKEAEKYREESEREHKKKNKQGTGLFWKHILFEHKGPKGGVWKKRESKTERGESWPASMNLTLLHRSPWILSPNITECRIVRFSKEKAFI